MPLRLPRAALASLALSGLVLSAAPAAAIEPDAVAEAIGAALVRGSKAVVGYESAAFDGDNVVIKGFTISRPSGSDSVRFDEAVIEAPTEDGPGIFQTPRMTFTGGTLDGDPSGTVGFATASDVTVLDPEETASDNFADGILYGTAEIRDVRLTREPEPGELVVARISARSAESADALHQESSGMVEGLSVSPEIFSRGRFNPATLGYDALLFDITWSGARDVETNTMDIRDFTFSFREGGDLSITGTIGNLPDPRVINDADVLAKAGDATLYGLTIRYSDNSFAGRVLDLLASEQQMSRTDYVRQISAALPFLLAPVSHPSFRNQLIAAVAAFLQEPLSLTVRLEPETPVSANEIAGLAESAPGSLPDLLGASVRANSQE